MTASAPEPGSPGPGIGTRLRELAGYLAPATVVGALLLYFGYVSTRARFLYFGVPLDLLDMSTQDLSLFGTDAVFVAAVLILLTLLVALAVHGVVSWMLARSGGGFLALTVAGVAAVAGALLLARGVLGVLDPALTRRNPPFQTSLSLAAGPVLLTYGAWIAVRLAPPDGTFIRWYASRPVRGLRRGALAAVAVLVVAGAFWAAGSYAASYGTGRGFEDARGLPGRPAIVLETVRPVPAEETGPGVTACAPARRQPGDRYRFRYCGLRLLAESGGRLFLVPASWRAGSSTLVVPYDDSVRLRLVPGPP